MSPLLVHNFVVQKFVYQRKNVYLRTKIDCYMEFKWEDDFTITVEIQGGEVVISANEAGLRSLANHFIALADDKARGAHFHLDENNSLEDGSTELVVQKIVE